MKPLPLFAWIVGCAWAASAAVTLPFYDPLTYSEGQLYLVGAGVWDAGGNAGPELVVTNLAALTAPDGLALAAGNGARWVPSGTARRAMVQFTTTSNGTLYASFLLNVATPPSSGSRLLAYFDSSTSQPSSPQLGFFVSNGSVGIAKKGSVPASSVTFGSGTHFVVLRYTFTGTSTDQADLWVDPAKETLSATPPVPDATASGANNAAALPYFGLYASSGSGPMLYLDEVRLGTNWAAVTPTNGTVTPTPAPVVTRAWMTPTGLVMQGSNGPASSEYGVVSANSPAPPSSAWWLVGKYSFDATGRFACTNPVDAVAAQQFYRLQIGNLPPPLPNAPVITNQPQDLTVAEGDSASFTVGVAGSMPLGYQWYFAPATLLAGKTAATLTLANLQTNQSGSYFAVVTNLAGAVTSTVASLTRDEHPAPRAGHHRAAGEHQCPGRRPRHLHRDRHRHATVGLPMVLQHNHGSR